MYESNSEERFLIRIVWKISYLAMTIGLAILTWVIPTQSHDRYLFYLREHNNDYLAFTVIHSFISGYSFGLLGISYLLISWATQDLFLSVTFNALPLYTLDYFIEQNVILISFVFWLLGCAPYYGIKWARQEKANQ